MSFNVRREYNRLKNAARTMTPEELAAYMETAYTQQQRDWIVNYSTFRTMKQLTEELRKDHQDRAKRN